MKILARNWRAIVMRRTRKRKKRKRIRVNSKYLSFPSKIS